MRASGRSRLTWRRRARLARFHVLSAALHALPLAGLVALDLDCASPVEATRVVDVELRPAEPDPDAWLLAERDARAEERRSGQKGEARHRAAPGEPRPLRIAVMAPAAVPAVGEASATATAAAAGEASATAEAPAPAGSAVAASAPVRTGVERIPTGARAAAAPLRTGVDRIPTEARAASAPVRTGVERIPTEARAAAAPVRPGVERIPTEARASETRPPEPRAAPAPAEPRTQVASAATAHALRAATATAWAGERAGEDPDARTAERLDAPSGPPPDPRAAERAAALARVSPAAQALLQATVSPLEATAPGLHGRSGVARSAARTVGDTLPWLRPGTVTEVSTRSSRLAAYIKQVKAKVEPLWAPRLAMRGGGRVSLPAGEWMAVVAVELGPRGELRSVQVTRTSGVPRLDDQAEALFRRAAPFPPPPEELLDGDGGLRFEVGTRSEI